VDWGFDWHNIPFITVIAPTVSLLQVLGSLGSLNTLIPSSRSLEVVGGAKSLDAAGYRILQLPVALAETVAEQDGTQVQLRT
jgi:hypothetical protein